MINSFAQVVSLFTSSKTQQWRNYGLGLGEPGGPQPQWAKWGPQAQAVEQKHWRGPLIYVTMSFSDHQNSVKSLPKVWEMAFQRV
jgi:hypothetical protein